MFYFFIFAMPAGDAWRGEKDFAHQVRVLVGDQSASLAFYNTGPIYYLGLPNPVPGFNPRRDAGRWRWVVMRERDVESLGLTANVVAREAVYPWDSKQHCLNAMVLVRMAPASGRSPPERPILSSRGKSRRHRWAPSISSRLDHGPVGEGIWRKSASPRAKMNQPHSATPSRSSTRPSKTSKS